MDKAAKQGAGVACAIAGILALTRYQTLSATALGIVLIGVGVWLMFSD